MLIPPDDDIIGVAWSLYALQVLEKEKRESRPLLVWGPGPGLREVGPRVGPTLGPAVGPQRGSEARARARARSGDGGPAARSCEHAMRARVSLAASAPSQLPLGFSHCAAEPHALP